MRLHWPRLLARLPVRARLTLAFTGVMAILLAAASIALSVLVAHNLDSTINDGLEAKSGSSQASCEDSSQAPKKIVTAAMRRQVTRPLRSHQIEGIDRSQADDDMSHIPSQCHLTRHSQGPCDPPRDVVRKSDTETNGRDRSPATGCDK